MTKYPIIERLPQEQRKGARGFSYVVSCFENGRWADKGSTTDFNVALERAKACEKGRVQEFRRKDKGE